MSYYMGSNWIGGREQVSIGKKVRAMMAVMTEAMEANVNTPFNEKNIFGIDSKDNEPGVL